MENNNILHVIVLNKNFTYLTTEPECTEAHKMKSKFPARTFVRVPFTVKNRKIQLCNEDQSVGYLAVSKRDICFATKGLRYKSKEEKEMAAKNYIASNLEDLNNIYFNK